MFTTLAWMPGPWEWAIIAVVALLIFGRKLPEVGRSLGKGIVEFKKGLKGVEEDLSAVDREVEDQARQQDTQPREPGKLEADAEPGNPYRQKDQAHNHS